MGRLPVLQFVFINLRGPQLHPPLPSVRETKMILSFHLRIRLSVLDSHDAISDGRSMRNCAARSRQIRRGEFEFGAIPYFLRHRGRRVAVIARLAFVWVWVCDPRRGEVSSVAPKPLPAGVRRKMLSMIACEEEITKYALVAWAQRRRRPKRGREESQRSQNQDGVKFN